MTTAAAIPGIDPFHAVAIRAALRTGIELRFRCDEQAWAGWTDPDEAESLLTDAVAAADQLAARVPLFAHDHQEWTARFARTTTEPAHRRARASVVHLERLVRASRRPVVVGDRSRFAGELDEAIVTPPTLDE
ncbi:MAG: hypothetical protein NVV70_03800 [Cellulomonas sp.]|nr:hypothetical protein [Cellulomonas sp.]MCR6647292.1 hypothetical protein [Cellulomonas sp.]